MFSPYVKATSAAIVATVAALIAGAEGDNSLSLYEGLVAVGAFVATWNATFFVPYSPLSSSNSEPTP